MEWGWSFFQPLLVEGSPGVSPRVCQLPGAGESPHTCTPGRNLPEEPEPYLAAYLHSAPLPWFLQYVMVRDLQTARSTFFLVNDWLSVETEANGGLVEKEVLAASKAHPARWPWAWPETRASCSRPVPAHR